MISFRLTSRPSKSSLGSGSVYPSRWASLTISLNRTPGLKLLKIKESEPESTASIFRIRSPLRIRSFSVEITGSPAPTFVSYWNKTPRCLAMVFSNLYWSKLEEVAILLGLKLKYSLPGWTHNGWRFPGWPYCLQKSYWPGLIVSSGQ